MSDLQYLGTILNMKWSNISLTCLTFTTESKNISNSNIRILRIIRIKKKNNNIKITCHTNSGY